MNREAKTTMAGVVPANILHDQNMLSDNRELRPDQRKCYRIWQSDASPYSNKVICYLNYTGIPYKRMRAPVEAMTGEIAELVGRPVVPVLLTPDNRSNAGLNCHYLGRGRVIPPGVLKIPVNKQALRDRI